MLAGEKKAKSPHDALFFYWDDALHAVRSGEWKLHFPHEYVQPAPVGGGGKPGKLARPKTPLALYHISKDVSESENLAERHPEIVARIEALAARARTDFGDSATKQKGAAVREPGRL